MRPVPEASEVLEVGDRVEVRRRFDAGWARGFQLVEVTPSGYRVRRRSDGAVLPVAFPFDEVRKERRRGMWWY